MKAGEGLSRGERAARWGIAGLSLLGVADALYMLSYTGGLVKSLACPFFGKGCDVVGRSSHAKHFGVPNAAVGAVGYAAMAALALWAGDSPPERRPWPSLGLAAASLSAFGASVYLTWAQAAKVKAWCFWCLSSAAINTMILPVALAEGRRAFRSLSRKGEPDAQEGARL
ncbi:MAG: vitamin K epoxide reductase family protein [Chloroflexota bacterium]